MVAETTLLSVSVVALTDKAVGRPVVAAGRFRF